MRNVQKQRQATTEPAAGSSVEPVIKRLSQGTLYVHRFCDLYVYCLTRDALFITPLMRFFSNTHKNEMATVALFCSVVHMLQFKTPEHIKNEHQLAPPPVPLSSKARALTKLNFSVICRPRDSVHMPLGVGKEGRTAEVGRVS